MNSAGDRRFQKRLRTKRTRQIINTTINPNIIIITFERYLFIMSIYWFRPIPVSLTPVIKGLINMLTNHIVSQSRAVKFGRES